MAAGLAYDIARWLIIIQATIGFVNGLGLFDDQYYQQDINNESAYETGSLDELAEEQTSPISYFDMLVTMVLGGFLMMIQIFLAVFFIFPTLVTQFYVPPSLASLLQVGIYWTYYGAIAELRMNRPLKSF
ncbi:MAG: hypothetical protein PHW82_17100 [Bacteroidales bacterium]|nr:hypothetical protein [Bacteroidales bacterium]